MINNENLTMLTDFYEITMANGYFQSGNVEDIAYFDMFFRKVPDGGGYAIMAGRAGSRVSEESSLHSRRYRIPQGKRYFL